MKKQNIPKDKKSEVFTVKKEKEIGGYKGLEPTRYGNKHPEWEIKGRVSDF